MPRPTTRQSITLVGRASQLELLDDKIQFILTIKPRRDYYPFTVVCLGETDRVIEQFERMDEGSLVGIIGTLTTFTHADPAGQFERPMVRLDRLEVLGKPMLVVEEEAEPQDWDDHPSLTAEERNPSLCR